jgi:hypothetical protein
MALSEQSRAIFLDAVSWARRHFAEILLAALFALPFAYFVGAYLEHPDPFTIYVVADADTLKETLDLFRTKEKVIGRIGDVDVRAVLEILADNNQETAQKMAQYLSNQPDTLMVIGSGRSQLVEKSLPIYFTARPQVPYLATVASDDDLLKDCNEQCYEWTVGRSMHKMRFAPLLQLSPTNKIQAASAVEFAIENGKHRFLIVLGNDTVNKSYEENMVMEYEASIQEAAKEGAIQVNKYPLDQLPNEESLKNMNPECVLYAGNYGEAQTLFTRLSGMKFVNHQILMIVSDSVIQTRPSPTQLSQEFQAQNPDSVLDLRFTHQAFASDYNSKVSTYDRDAFAIATALIEDLNERRVDFRMQFKALLHIHSASDARRNLVRVMKKNAALRTWYEGDAEQSEHPITYVFKGYNQYNAIFHVWRLEGPETSPGPGMEDVDHWHPGRGIRSAQQSAPRSDQD